jgi:hypothetical protein
VRPKVLVELGTQGFELCWVLLEQALQKQQDGRVLIFKRPKPAAKGVAASTRKGSSVKRRPTLSG